VINKSLGSKKYQVISETSLRSHQAKEVRSNFAAEATSNVTTQPQITKKGRDWKYICDMVLYVASKRTVRREGGPYD